MKNWSTLKKLIWLHILQGASAILKTVTGNAPVSLTNAVAREIHSLTQYGLCTQASTPSPSTPVDIVCNNGDLKMVDDELPDGYKRVLGFACNNNAMWQITDFHLRGSDTVKVSFSVTAACNVWGCYQSTSATDNYDLYATTTSGGKYFRYASGTYASYFSSENQGKRFDVVYTPTGSIGMPEDSTWTEASFESANDLLLGSTTVGGTSSKLKGNLYGEFIVENGGAERLHLVPCERLSDNVLGYYDLVGEVFYEPYSGYDGAVSLGYDGSHYHLQTVGSPASANLYDASKRVEGYKIGSDGTLTNNADMCYSAPIPVTAGGSVTLSLICGKAGFQRFIAFYTDAGEPSSTNFVSIVNTSFPAIGSVETKNTTVPNGASYARINVGNLDTDVMLNVGSLEQYIPYIEGECITLPIHQASILDESTNITGYYLNGSGVATEGADAQYTDLIPVNQHEWYKWSLSSSVGGNDRMHGYKADGTWKQQIAYKTSSASFEIIAQIPTDVAYVRLSYHIGDTDVKFCKSIIQYATAENLYSVGDTKDTQDIISGLLTHNTRVVVFDGTESGWSADFNTASGTIARFYMNGFGVGASGRTRVLCTHFNYSNGNNDGAVFIAASGHLFFERLTADGFNTKDAWLDWLKAQYAAGTPVICVVPLAEPTTESVTPQPLTTAEGTNIVSVTAEVSPVELEVKYYAIPSRDILSTLIGTKLTKNDITEKDAEDIINVITGEEK